jgi:hAT family C-terminal dimerisation region
MEMDFLQEYGSAITNEDDIERYFNTPQVNFVLNEKECQVKWVLNWWAAYKQEYPLIFAVVRNYLPIPGAEVDIERLFNIARDILGLRRMAISSGTLRALILLKDHIYREVAGQV